VSVSFISACQAAVLGGCVLGITHSDFIFQVGYYGFFGGVIMIDDPLNRLKVKRGSELPWTKLDESDVELIHALFSERNRLKKELSSLTNKSIAEKFGVHLRTIERISAGETWIHV